MNASFLVINEMQQLTFGWTDYLLFIGLLGVSLLIGVYFGFFSKQDSAAEYLFGGKTMSYIPVAISILASLLSGITFLGIPTEVYFHGAQYFLTAMPAVICCSITAYVFIPIFHNLQLTSSYEYLELRFSKTIRTLASSLYIVSLMIYIPIVIYVPALAFSQVTGYNIHIITPIFSLVCISYTSMGGVKAVVWTDTIQFFFTIGGLFTVLIIGLRSVGGFSEVWKIADEGKRLDIFDMDPSPFLRNTFWGMTIGQLFANLSRFTVGQKFIQRFLAIGSKTDIRKALFLLAFGWISLQFCCVITGLIIYAKYHDCDPLTAKLVKRNDQTLPYYVMDVAGRIPGLPGIFLAGLVSSALSTMSASLNTLSGIIYRDFIDQWIAESPKKDAKSANIMKLTSLLIGLITIALIFVIERLGTIFEIANSLSSIVDGPLFGLFVLGMFFPWVGKTGAVWGVFTALATMTWIVGGAQWNILHKRIQFSTLPTTVDNCPYPLNETVKHNVLLIPAEVPLSSEEEPWLIFRISILFLIMTGTLITILVGIVTSLVIGETDLANVNPKHLASFVQRFLPQKKYAEVPLHDVSQEKIKH